MIRAAWAGLAIGAACAVGGVVVAARVRPRAGAHDAAPAPGEAALAVPHVAGAIVLDGDLDDPGWTAAVARTGAFRGDDGAPARPFSEARLAWGDGHLYVALYAADEDVRASHEGHDAPLWLDDAFQLTFTRGDDVRTIDVSPLGSITDGRRVGAGPVDYAWTSGAHVARDVDGTVNDAADDDEEWIVELAIPFEALGLEGTPGERIGFAVQRCDTPHHAPRTCAAWPGGAQRGGAGGAGGGAIVLSSPL